MRLAFDGPLAPSREESRRFACNTGSGPPRSFALGTWRCHREATSSRDQRCSALGWLRMTCGPGRTSYPVPPTSIKSPVPSPPSTCPPPPLPFNHSAHQRRNQRMPARGRSSIEMTSPRSCLGLNQAKSRISNAAFARNKFSGVVSICLHVKRQNTIHPHTRNRID